MQARNGFMASFSQQPDDIQANYKQRARQMQVQRKRQRGLIAEGGDDGNDNANTESIYEKDVLFGLGSKHLPLSEQAVAKVFSALPLLKERGDFVQLQSISATDLHKRPSSKTKGTSQERLSVIIQVAWELTLGCALQTPEPNISS